MVIKLQKNIPPTSTSRYSKNKLIAVFIAIVVVISSLTVLLLFVAPKKLFQGMPPQGITYASKQTKNDSKAKAIYMPTKIIIENQQVFIPATISKYGNQYTGYMLVDTTASTTSIPSAYLSQLQPKWQPKKILKNTKWTTGAHKIQLDVLVVGPFHDGSFTVSVSDEFRNGTAGIIGMDFLSRHPFKIDHKKQIIDWQ